MSTNRISWDQYFFNLAVAASHRAACTRSQVGAVLVKDNRVTAAGYNGSPAGEVHCVDGGCPRGLTSDEDLPHRFSYDNCIALHAEINCLAYANVSARGSDIYITRSPCPWCRKVLKAFGISRAIYPLEDVYFPKEVDYRDIELCIEIINDN